MKKILNSIKQYYKVKKSEFREKKKSKKRSPKWDEIRDFFVYNIQPSCAACGTTKKLQVHHIKPFNEYPELELDMNNLITLCMDKETCHLDLGHCDNFKKSNPNIVSDAFLYRNAITLEEKKLLKEKIKNESKKS